MWKAHRYEVFGAKDISLEIQKPSRDSVPKDIYYERGHQIDNRLNNNKM